MVSSVSNGPNEQGRDTSSFTCHKLIDVVDVFQSEVKDIVDVILVRTVVGEFFLVRR